MTPERTFTHCGFSCRSVMRPRQFELWRHETTSDKLARGIYSTCLKGIALNDQPTQKPVVIDVMGLRLVAMIDAPWADLILSGQRDWAAKLRRDRRAARDAVRRASRDHNAPIEVIAAVIAKIQQCSINVSSSVRLATLLRLLAPPAPTSVFWPALLSEWSMCDATWNATPQLLDLLRRHHGIAPWVGYYQPSAESLGSIMDDPRHFWAALPDIVTVYRGCSRARVLGVAWTTDRAVAERFAEGHRGIRTPNPVVASARIAKADIFATFVDRAESEVLVDPERLVDINIVNFVCTMAERDCGSLHR